MASDIDHQAAFRARRKANGYRKLSLLLSPEEAELLEAMKRQHKTDKGAVLAALRMAVGV